MAAKNNQVKRARQNSGIEVGAWMLSAAFFTWMLWMATNIIQRVFLF
ncbi:MAG: hypothetical protein ABIO46_01805 [Chitinophagales bacterium]